MHQSKLMWRHIWLKRERILQTTEVRSTSLKRIGEFGSHIFWIRNSNGSSAIIEAKQSIKARCLSCILERSKGLRHSIGTKSFKWGHCEIRTSSEGREDQRQFDGHASIQACVYSETLPYQLPAWSSKKKHARQETGSGRRSTTEDRDDGDTYGKAQCEKSGTKTSQPMHQSDIKQR